MRVLQAYKSRKYLLRIMLSITFLMVVFLSLSSAVLHYSSEKRVLHIQQEANQKVMNQINHNIVYMQEIVKNLALRLYGGHEIIPLMTDIATDPFETINSIRQLNSVQDSNAFLHSILIVNGHSNEIHAFGELSKEKPGYNLAIKMAQMIKGNKKLPQMRLLPMNISGGENSVDFFSMLIYETFKDNSQTDSVLIFNIKPEWLFDNIKSVNEFAAPEQTSLFMTDHTGQIIISGNQAQIPAIDQLRDELIKQQQAGKDELGFFTPTFDNEKYMVSYMKIGAGDWNVVSVQPYKAVLGDIVKMRTTSVGVIICFLVLSVIFSIVVAHKLYKPVQTMVMNIKTKTETGTDAAYKGKDELSFVTEFHNELVHKLYTTTDERNKQKKIVSNYYLRSILSNSLSFSEHEFKECVELNGLRINHDGPMQLVIVKFDNQTEFFNQISHNQRTLFLFAVSNIAEEIFSNGTCSCEVVDMRGDHLIIILSGEGASDHVQEDVYARLKQIQDIVLDYYKLSVTMTLSDIMMSHRDITSSYNHALQNSMYKLLFGKKAIITPEKVRSNNEQLEYHIPSELEKKLIEAIRTNDLSMMNHCVSQLMKHLSAFHYDHIIHGVLHLVDIIKATVREINGLRISTITIDLSSLSREILEKETIEEMEVHFLHTCGEIHDKLKHPEQDKNAILVDSVKEIITDNYHDINLSLQSIASTLKMTPAYIGRVFKQSEFVSVGESLNEFRLNKAREFLETKNLSIKEIMEQVGFLNESTFFKLFKKKYGVTPKEYRLKRSIV